MKQLNYPQPHVILQTGTLVSSVAPKPRGSPGSPDQSFRKHYTSQSPARDPFIEVEIWKKNYQELEREMSRRQLVNDQVDKLVQQLNQLQVENASLKQHAQEYQQYIQQLQSNRETEISQQFKLKTTTYELVVLQQAVEYLQILKQQITMKNKDQLSPLNKIIKLENENAKLTVKVNSLELDNQILKEENQSLKRRQNLNTTPTQNQTIVEDIREQFTQPKLYPSKGTSPMKSIGESGKQGSAHINI